MKTILLFIAFFGCCSSAPILQNVAKYYKQDIKMFDDIYTYGIWDLKFDQNLYGYQGFGSVACFENQSCRSSNMLCDPCDWTDPLICSGQKRGPNTTCPCGNPPAMCFPELSPFDVGVWNPNSNFTIVEIRSGIIDVAYHPKPPNNCSCIIFKVDVIEGDIEGVLLLYGEAFDGFTGLMVLSRHKTATVCPSDPRWGQSHVARIVGLGAKVPYSKVLLSIEYKNVTKLIHSSKCVVPSNLSSTHQCLPTGVLTTLSPLPGFSYIRVIIDPPPNERCGTIGFWATSNEHLLSTNPWVSPQNSTNAYRTHRKGPADNRPWPSLYPYCLKPGESLYAFILSSSKVTFFIDTSKEWMILRPFSELTPSDFFSRFFGSVTAHCPNKNFTAHRSIYSVSETMDTGSSNLRVVYPSDDMDVFYPPPLFASNPYYLVKGIPKKPFTPKRLIVSLLINQRLSTRSQPLVWRQPWFQNSYEWLTIDEWKECTLNVKGIIADENGNELNLMINGNDVRSELPSCKPSSYAESSQMIDDIQEQTTDLIYQNDVNLPDIYRLWFLQDRIAATNEFYSCKNTIQSYYKVAKVENKIILTDQCVSSFNASEFKNDPCCTLNEGSLYDNCLVDYRNITEQYKIIQYTDYINNCSNQQCAQASLTNLLLQLNLDKDSLACTNAVDRPEDQNIYWKCIKKIWGPEPLQFAGPNCTHDIDCPGSLCSIHSGHCFVDIATAEIELISCIYDGLTKFTKTFVSNELNLNPLDPNIKNLWQSKFSEQFLCSDPHTPIGFNTNLAVYGACYGCDGYLPNTSEYVSNWAFSPGESWPNFGYSCWAPGSSSCSITSSLYSAKSYCATQGCNNIPYDQKGFFPFLSAPTFCSNRTYCGISDDNFFYEDVTDVISVPNCIGENLTVCILANGSKIQTNTSSECNSIMSCDVDCNGRPCLNEIECSNAGSCSDVSDYDVGIWTNLYKTETAGCFFTIRYHDPFNPTVSICEPPFRNTIIGCSVYPGPSGLPSGSTNLFPINQSACETGNFQWGDPSIFELIGPKWITPAKTKFQCSNYGNVCDDPIKSYPAGASTYSNTFTFNDQCATSRELFTWTAGRWLPGQARTATIVVGKIATRFSNVSRVGLNLPKILSNLTKAVNKLQSLKVQSSAFCKNTYKKSLDQLVCSCITGYNESFCYTKKVNISNIGVACDESSTITAGDLKIILTEKSLPPATCDNLFITTSSIVTYQSRQITPLRTLLVNYEEDTEYAIRNKQLGIYGKILTNGYSALFDTTIVNITICIKLSTLRTDYLDQLNKYPKLDLAKINSGNLLDDLNPLYINVEVGENNEFCANITHFESDQIYYFIQRIDSNYTFEERTVFSQNDIVYISILLALYCFGEIFVTVKFSYLTYAIYIGENSSKYAVFRLATVLFLMFTFFLFRIILFSLLLNQGLLGSSSTRAISYLLFEFPILLYFAFVTNYICIFITFILNHSKLDTTNQIQRKFNIANFISIAVNLVILIVFIIIIILFETIIFEPYFICGGSILLYDTSDSTSLLLAYRIIFSSISIVVGILLFITAIRFGYLLSDPVYELPLFNRIKFYILSLAGGLGLIGQAIYFLIITVTNSTPVNYVSLTILLVLEIIPALCFIFVDTIKKPVKKTKTSKKSSGTPKSTKSSGGSIAND